VLPQAQPLQWDMRSQTSAGRPIKDSIYLPVQNTSNF